MYVCHHEFIISRRVTAAAMLANVGVSWRAFSAWLKRLTGVPAASVKDGECASGLFSLRTTMSGCCAADVSFLPNEAPVHKAAIMERLYRPLFRITSAARPPPDNSTFCCLGQTMKTPWKGSESVNRHWKEGEDELHHISVLHGLTALSKTVWSDVARSNLVGMEGSKKSSEAMHENPLEVNHFDSKGPI